VCVSVTFIQGKHPFGAVACRCHTASGIEARLISPGHQGLAVAVAVGIGSHHILSIYWQFCGWPGGLYIKMLFIIYTTHWLLLLLILLFVFVFVFVYVYCSISLIKFLPSSASCLALLSAFSASFYQFFILFMNSRRFASPSRYLPNDKYSFCCSSCCFCFFLFCLSCCCCYGCCFWSSAFSLLFCIQIYLQHIKTYIFAYINTYIIFIYCVFFLIIEFE